MDMMDATEAGSVFGRVAVTNLKDFGSGPAEIPDFHLHIISICPSLNLVSVTGGFCCSLINILSLCNATMGDTSEDQCVYGRDVVFTH